MYVPITGLLNVNVVLEVRVVSATFPDIQLIVDVVVDAVTLCLTSITFCAVSNKSNFLSVPLTLTDHEDIVVFVSADTVPAVVPELPTTN